MLNLKKFLVSISLFTLFSLGCIGLIKINMINTKALSPLGNTKSNYKLVNEEFGDDFSQFIQDNAEIKIYTQNGIVIRVGKTDFKLTLGK